MSKLERIANSEIVSIACDFIVTERDGSVIEERFEMLSFAREIEEITIESIAEWFAELKDIKMTGESVARLVLAMKENM